MIHIIVQDTDASELYRFEGKDMMSFLEMMEEKMMDYPYSCRSGACFSCVARVISGIEHVDFGKLGMPLIDLDADQILTCVAGIKSECFQVDTDQTIVLQKV